MVICWHRWKQSPVEREQRANVSPPWFVGTTGSRAQLKESRRGMSLHHGRAVPGPLQGVCSYAPSWTFSCLEFYLPLLSYLIFSWGFLLTVENLGFPGEAALGLRCGNVITTITDAQTEDGGSAVPCWALHTVLRRCPISLWSSPSSMKKTKLYRRKALPPCHACGRSERTKASQPARQEGDVRKARSTYRMRGHPWFRDTTALGVPQHLLGGDGLLWRVDGANLTVTQSLAGRAKLSSNIWENVVCHLCWLLFLWQHFKKWLLETWRRTSVPRSLSNFPIYNQLV